MPISTAFARLCLAHKSSHRRTYKVRSFVRWSLEFTEQHRAIRTVVLTSIYTCTLALCFWTAYQVRFDFDVPPKFQTFFLFAALVTICAKLIILFAFHQFDGRLTYFGKPDLKRLVVACMVGTLPFAAMAIVRVFASAPPRGIVPIDFVLCVLALSAVRLGFWRVRAFAFLACQASRRKPRRVGIVGAGNAGALLAMHAMDEPSLGLEPVAFFDDVCGRGASVHGIAVVGAPERIAEFKVKLRIEQLIIAMPSAPARRIREVVELAHAAGLECKTVPSLGQLATGRVSISTLRPVKIEDLLGRVAVRIKTGVIRDILASRTVMVTGAGGSIGSELCRQILSFKPALLVLVERSEPVLFAIEQELLASRNGTSIVPLVGDVTNSAHISAIFSRFRPQAVFHAAAHKHVPMLEHQPAEAVRNNVLGTALVAEMAIAHGAENFVFISTDKAVNPSSVMGATKRCAEIYLQSLAARSHATKFMAVRFGNVLGSSGSVVPTFAKQIAAGGPVTVTHPEVSRFFMTIPEAVTLVLEASALGKGGDIFMLDMGKSIKIVDLAAQMILLSGFKPEDIDIIFTGLRPGEKLEEILSYSREHVTPTEHPQISRLVSPAQDYSCVRPLIEELASAAEDLDLSTDELKDLLVKAVPEYTPFLTNAANTSRHDARGSVSEESTGVLSALSGMATE
jgi:FlaA1/EpsC-like NDP-sugar epimerase